MRNKKYVLFLVSIVFISCVYVSAVTGRTIMEHLLNPGLFARLTQLINQLREKTSFFNPLEKRGLIGAKVTLFAPTDRAFSKFRRSGLLTKDKDLQKFINYHMVKGRVSRKSLKRRRRSFRTLAGARLNPKEIGEPLATIELQNGNIHIIDRVLVPLDLKDVLKLNK